MLGLEKHSILESFTSLSTEFIIPWSNTNIKRGFFNMPVRCAAAGHLSFGGNRHRSKQSGSKIGLGFSAPLNLVIRQKRREWCLLFF